MFPNPTPEDMGIKHTHEIALKKDDRKIQNFETNEITMEEFLDLVLENGHDYNVEWGEFINDDSQYLITLNNLNKVVQITGGSSSGSEFIFLELMP